MQFYLAPMEGLTGYVYRNAYHKYFPAADRYFTPFIFIKKNEFPRTERYSPGAQRRNDGDSADSH